MSDKQWYVAYILDIFGPGKQMLRVMFEGPIEEFWAEPDAQEKLEAIFKNKYDLGANEKIVCIEQSDIFRVLG